MTVFLRGYGVEFGSIIRGTRSEKRSINELAGVDVPGDARAHVP
jgi:hypothetical protein